MKTNNQKIENWRTMLVRLVARIGAFSPLTPALSPLRGEGARPASLENGLPLAAFNDAFPHEERAGTRLRASEQPPASNATPSPLNGERAGVRGESFRWLPFFVAGSARPSLLTLACLLLASTTLRAELPEPDNIIYGVITRNGLPVHATDTDVVLEARRNSDGAVVASYRMGDSARSGDNFTLRVPLEVFTPVFDSLSSLTGTAMTIVASDFNGSFAEVPFTMGGRGQFHQLNISHFLGFDSDGDGLLDEWEMFWFGNLLQSSITDKDGDDSTDGEEYLAGTDPNNGNSRFRLQIQRTGTTGKEVSFVAQAAAGNGYQGKIRSYTLEWTTDLNSNSWIPLTGYIGVVGAGQTVRYPVPPQGPATVFYRAVIQLN